MAEYLSTTGADKIAGTSKDDVIYAGGGDTVNSGAGDDTIYLDEGNNVVNAGTGDDLIVASGSGNNVLSGDAGNDIIIGGGGSDTITGGIGNDVLTGGAGADVFQFKKGFEQDVITDLNFAEGDYVNLYAGSIDGVSKNIQLKSMDDIDKLVSDGYAIKSTTSSGALVLSFNKGADSITLQGFGTPATPNVAGTSGNDILLGSNAAQSHIVAGSGNDIASAGPNGAAVEGNAGNDTLIGGAGNDTLGGQSGDDILIGGAGNDRLTGGTGNDVLTGGVGADAFVFTSGFGNDVITDLSFAESDTLSFGSTKISSLSQLNDYIAATPGAFVSSDLGSATVNLGGDSIRLIGYSATGNTLTLAGNTIPL